MKVLKVFTPASAAVLLIGKGPTRTSAASWDLAVPDDTLTERRDVASASTNTALLAVAGIMCGRTSSNTHTTDSIWAEAVPTLRSPAVHMTHALVLAGNQEGGTIEIHRFFNELTTQFYALVLVDAQDGVIDTPGTFLVFVETRDRWDTPLKQVSAGSAVATRADQYYDDNNFTRSTKFVWEFPTPPDQFMTRLVNMPLHLFNTLNAEHVNTILYSRRCRYSQSYRVNPNNTRNRRYRMFSRVTSDIAWILWDSWGARNRFQVVSPFCGGEETWEANEETKETPSCPVASPWLEMTAPTDGVLPPASPAAVLTPSDVVMTTVPSLRKFSARVEKKASFPIAAAWPEMAAPSDAALSPAFPPMKLTERDTSSCPVASVSLEVAAPTDFALSPAFPAAVLTHFEAVVATLPSLSNSSPRVERDKSCRMEQRDALMQGIVVGTVGLYFKAGYYPQHVRCAQATLYTAGEIATSFDALDGHVSMFLTVHRFVCCQDSPFSLALLHNIDKTSYSALDGYAATSLSYLRIGYQATTSSKALQPAAAWSHLQRPLLHAIGRQMLPRATGREVATHAFGSFEASLEPMSPEVVPMTSTLNRTSDSMTVITTALVDAWTSSLPSQLLTADGRAVVIIPFEAFQYSIGPLFSTATPTTTALNRTSDAVMIKTAASRNTSSIRLFRSQSLAAISLFHRSDSNRSLIMPKIGWNGTIPTGLYRCSADTGPMEQLDLRWAMMKSLQGVRNQSRHYTAAAETPPSFNGLGRHDRHEPMSLGYLIETYPLTVSVFALSLYICAVWLGGMFM